jgi:hypothetical protein
MVSFTAEYDKPAPNDINVQICVPSYTHCVCLCVRPQISLAAAVQLQLFLQLCLHTLL